MKGRPAWWILLAGIIGMLAVIPVGGWRGAAQPAAGAASFTIATATAGGRYYRVGEALARQWEALLPGVAFPVLATGGSPQNLELLADGDAQIALVAADVGYRAYRGEGAWASRPEGRYGDIRLLGYAYVEVAHLATKGAWRGLQGLHGKSLAVGLPGSREESVFRAALEPALQRWGVDVRLQFLGLGDALEQVELGWIDGFFHLGAAPLPSETPWAQLKLELRGLEEAFGGGAPAPAAGPAAAAEGDPAGDGPAEPVPGAAAEAPGWVLPVVIPPGVYPRQEEAVATFGVPVMVVAWEGIGEDVAYALAASLDEAAARFAAEQPFQWDRAALAGLEGDQLPFPLHPGAERYWRGQQQGGASVRPANP